MTDSDILKALEIKHSDDILIGECKDGPTQGCRHVRMDAWVMKRSWAHPRIIAYEIKTSKGDFNQDQKWHKYLPLCNELYFICPWGLIQSSQVPASTGLMWVTKGSSGRVHTKKKADYRDIEEPVDVYKYILICRMNSLTHRETESRDNLEFWQEWLKKKELSRQVGWKVNKALRLGTLAEISRVEDENTKLREENKRLADVARFCEQMGINVRTEWDMRHRLRGLLKDLNGRTMVENMSRLEGEISCFRKRLEEGLGTKAQDILDAIA